MPTPNPVIARIERSIGVPGLAGKLADSLRRTDLTTLLMQVFARRTAGVTPTALLERYREDAFVAPAAGDMRARLDFERLALEAASDFEPVELSPLAPLGTCTAVAPVSPDLVEHTTRSREVVSDPSNVLALEAARRRADAIAADGKGAAPVALCTSHRVVRTLQVTRPGLLQHFRIFALVTSGRARAGLELEFEALRAHLRVHIALMLRAGVPLVRLTLYDRSGQHTEAFTAGVIEPLRAEHDFGARIEQHRAGGESYYPGISFSLDDASTGANIADGGVVDWTAKLLANGRERCIISGSGVDRLLARSTWADDT